MQKSSRARASHLQPVQNEFHLGLGGLLNSLWKTKCLSIQQNKTCLKTASSLTLVRRRIALPLIPLWITRIFRGTTVIGQDWSTGDWRRLAMARCTGTRRVLVSVRCSMTCGRGMMARTWVTHSWLLYWPTGMKGWPLFNTSKWKVVYNVITWMRMAQSAKQTGIAPPYAENRGSAIVLCRALGSQLCGFDSWSSWTPLHQSKLRNQPH